MVNDSILGRLALLAWNQADFLRGLSGQKAPQESKDNRDLKIRYGEVLLRRNDAKRELKLARLDILGGIPPKFKH